MTQQHDSIILRFITRVFLLPLLFVFSVYVFIHGETSPGGGFQAGAILAATVILGRLTLGAEHAGRRLPTRLLVWMSCLGVGIYVVTGIVPQLVGLNYLDYAGLPLEWFNAIAAEERTLRAMGIFLVEVGVFIGVASVLVILYDYLTER